MQVCTSLQTDNHASTPSLSFLQAGCPSCRQTNSVKALKDVTLLQINYLSEQHLGKLTMQVSSFCQDIFEMYLKKYVANTTK